VSEKSKRIEQFMLAGGTFSDCVHYFGKRQSEKELSFIEPAKKQYEDEGTLEFDDVPIVSMPETDESAEEHTGAYVMAWVWVEK